MTLRHGGDPRIIHWNRRKFIGVCGLASLFPVARSSGANANANPFASFDAEIENFMRARQVPGGALAVVKDRRLVYARGYGWADREQKLPPRADTLFRIASVSKPVTAVAVLKWVEQGRLNLDARVFELVTPPPILAPGAAPDDRLQRITVRHLLHHTGGWDREKSFDPMFRARQIAEAARVPGPAGPDEIIRFMLGQPLDFDPGTRQAYSNFGYCVLGRVIEKISGWPYEQFVRKQILEPAGIKQMRLGHSLERQRAKNETHYYSAENGSADNVFPGEPEKTPWPYGGFHLEAMDAHGGWLASAVDLARFAAALDNPSHCPWLRPETIRTMYAPPAPPVARNAAGSLENNWYASGWNVRPVKGEGKANYWHSGSLPGTATLLVRRWDGLGWAVLFNQRSENSDRPDSAIDAALHRAADAVTHWPRQDLFGHFR